MNYECHSVLAIGGFESCEAELRKWSSQGWELVTVTNGHWGAQISPPGVTLWLRRPLPAAPKLSETVSPAARPRKTK